MHERQAVVAARSFFPPPPQLAAGRGGVKISFFLSFAEEEEGVHIRRISLSVLNQARAEKKSVVHIR